MRASSVARYSSLTLYTSLLGEKLIVWEVCELSGDSELPTELSSECKRLYKTELSGT